MSSAINEGLMGEGVSLMGCELGLAGALALARQRYKRMPLCVVEEWVILDAILTEDEQAKVAAAGCQPMFLFAHKVVHDEQRRFEPGDWVRSTIARTFNEGYLFETRNTVYVLKGPGQRKSSSLQGIFSIF
ncbi:DUF6957 family protein [Pseudomonas guariconensis]|uniref:DUF6957 family protein n=1 Tax=Pseudomonas guariconensis TaxID=1288410 RepID=UPI00366ADD26